MRSDDIPLWVLIGAAAGFVIGYGASGYAPTQKDVWDITTAVGTAMAVVVALGISVKGARDMQRERRDRGLIALVFLNSPLGALQRDLQYMIDALTEYDDDALGHLNYYSTNVFEALRHHALRLLDAQTLETLAGLADDIALHLGFAASTLNSKREETALCGNLAIWSGLAPQTRQATIASCRHAALQASISVGYANRRASDLLRADKKRVLKLAHRMYTEKRLGPPISLDEVLSWVD